MVHNAVGEAFGTFQEIDPAILARRGSTSYLIIDAVIDLDWTRKMRAELLAGPSTAG